VLLLLLRGEVRFLSLLLQGHPLQAPHTAHGLQDRGNPDGESRRHR
jgi:hypothetical protein